MTNWRLASELSDPCLPSQYLSGLVPNPLLLDYLIIRIALKYELYHWFDIGGHREVWLHFLRSRNTFYYLIQNGKVGRLMRFRRVLFDLYFLVFAQLYPQMNQFTNHWNLKSLKNPYFWTYLHIHAVKFSIYFSSCLDILAIASELKWSPSITQVTHLQTSDWRSLLSND